LDQPPQWGFILSPHGLISYSLARLPPSGDAAMDLELLVKIEGEARRAVRALNLKTADLAHARSAPAAQGKQSTMQLLAKIARKGR
jgi:hypothetical protein